MKSVGTFIIPKNISRRFIVFVLLVCSLTNYHKPSFVLRNAKCDHLSSVRLSESSGERLEQSFGGPLNLPSHLAPRRVYQQSFRISPRFAGLFTFFSPCGEVRIVSVALSLLVGLMTSGSVLPATIFHGARTFLERY